MAFKSFDDIVGPVVLPIRNKTYTLPTVSLDDGIRMHAAAANGGSLPLIDLIEIILGDTRHEMEKDGVPASVMDRALWTGVADFQSGREAAEAVWEHGVPKAILATLLQPVQDQMTQQVEAPTTPGPDSGNGMNAKRKTPATPSPGRKSSQKNAGRSSSRTSPVSTASDSTVNVPDGKNSST